MVTVPGAAAGERLDRFLASALPGLSRARVQRLLAEGCVGLPEGVPARPSARLRGGERIVVTIPAPRPAEPVPEERPLDVLFEDPHIMVIDKPAGIVVHPAPGHDRGTLVNILLARAEGLSGIGGVARPGIVHRLDKDTSGILVVAKTDQAHAGLTAQFARHLVDRRYHAVVWGRPPTLEGTVETQVGRHPVQRKKMAVLRSGGRRAVSRFRLLESAGGFSKVEFRLETGRTHQVRLHCAHLGCPVVGDDVYGKSRRIALGGPGARPIAVSRCLLHAFRLGFVHPVTGEPLRFETPDPPEFEEFLNAAAAAARRR